MNDFSDKSNKNSGNERSRLGGIGSSGEFIFKDFIRVSTMSCVGNEKHDHWF